MAGNAVESLLIFGLGVASVLLLRFLSEKWHQDRISSAVLDEVKETLERSGESLQVVKEALEEVDREQEELETERESAKEVVKGIDPSLPAEEKLERFKWPE